jgi:hypothetical protein
LRVWKKFRDKERNEKKLETNSSGGWRQQQQGCQMVTFFQTKILVIFGKPGIGTF